MANSKHTYSKKNEKANTIIMRFNQSWINQGQGPNIILINGNNTKKNAATQALGVGKSKHKKLSEKWSSRIYIKFAIDVIATLMSNSGAPNIHWCLVILE